MRLDVFAPSVLARIREGIVASPHLGRSVLSEAFTGTTGFSVVFTRAGLPRVRDELGYLDAYLDRVLLPSCNAFYLNPLIMAGGSQVDEHVDCTLSHHGGEDLRPMFVAVLYVAVPPDLRGGELVLRKGGRELGRVVPRTGGLLYFAGRLHHRVSPVQSNQQRISLVCEQYRLDDRVLARIPTLAIQAGGPGEQH